MILTDFNWVTFTALVSINVFVSMSWLTHPHFLVFSNSITFFFILAFSPDGSNV